MSLKMKLLVFALLGSACARGEKTGQEIAYLIGAEVILLPLIVLCIVFLHLNYRDIVYAVKSSCRPIHNNVEMKPLIKISEPEMEP